MLPAMRTKILIAAFVLDAACAIAAPFALGLFPKTADAAEDAGMQIGFLLAAANVVLAYEMEPACTRAALHLPGATDAPPAERVAGNEANQRYREPEPKTANVSRPH